jgi:soluble lytic murein transglycosylase
VNRLRWLIPLGSLCALALACNFPTYQSTQPTPTPSVTPSPVFTPTPTATPTPSPTPTPLPAARIHLGDQALLAGDWDAATSEFQTALEASPDSEIQYAARLGIGRTLFLAGDTEQAEQVLDDLIGEAGDSPVLAEAYFFLGQVLDIQERYPEAAEAYAKYLQFRPGVIDGYIQELRGDALQAAGDYAGAIAAYQAAIAAPRLNPELGLELKLASAYELAGDLPTAIVAYQDIYNRTSNDFTKAHMDLRLGQAHTALGQTEQAQAAYLDAVMNYPSSYDSYSALSDLVEAGVPVDEFQRGLVDYYAGQYGVAIAAFDRYLRADPPDPARALHYTGLSQAGLGEYPGAIETWDRVIQSYPDSEFWDEAWEMKAYTLWVQLNQFQEAVQVLLDFVATVPTHPRAAEFLFDAASVAGGSQARSGCQPVGAHSRRISRIREGGARYVPGRRHPLPHRQLRQGPRRFSARPGNDQ